MNKEGEDANVVPVNDEPITDRKPKGPNRRQFLGGVSGVAAAAATFGAIGLEPLVGGKNSVAKASVISYPVDRRADASLRYRTETAKAEDILAKVERCRQRLEEISPGCTKPKKRLKKAA